jgi:hypothetical protein
MSMVQEHKLDNPGSRPCLIRAGILLIFATNVVTSTLSLTVVGESTHTFFKGL